VAKIRIGIDGTGVICHQHYNAFAANPDVEIVGLCTHSNISKLHEMCGSWGVRAFGSFSEMASSPDIDAIVIASINSDHPAHIREATANKKHLLIEKPVLTDPELFDDICADADRQGIILFPGHNFAYRPELNKAKEIVLSGEIGQTCYVSFVATHLIAPQRAAGWRGDSSLSGGGALMDSGFHLVYQMAHLKGYPKDVFGYCSSIVRKDTLVEDTALVSVRYSDGTLGNVLQIWSSAHGSAVSGIHVVGTQGELHITDALYLNGDRLMEASTYADTFRYQAEAFAAAIKSGTGPLSTMDDAKRCLELILHAYQGDR